MRTVTVQFFANNGTSTLGASADVSTSMVDLADISWTFDERFCKAEPGQIALKIGDEDGSIWTWLQGQLATTRDGIPQLLNPWLTVTVGGTRAFLGLVDLASIQRDFASRMIDLAADDWSVLLRDLPLEGETWQRTLPRTQVVRPAAGPWTGTRSDEYQLDMVRFYPARDIQVGDRLQESATPYPVTAVVRQGVVDANGKSTGTEQFVLLKGWSQSGTGSWSFSRLAANTAEIGGYTVQADVDPKTAASSFGLRMKLDSVDNLTAGDALVTPSNAEVQLVDVDPEAQVCTLSQPVGETITAGTVLKYSAETAAQLTFQDARDVIKKAVAPYKVDLTRFQQASLPRPVLAWLPMRQDGVDLRKIADMEPTLTQTRLLAPTSTGPAYTGTPATGWTEGTVGTKYADWTGHRSTAPAYLVPDDRASVPGLTGRRNRVYEQRSYNKPVWVVSDVPQDQPSWSPNLVVWPKACYAVDYAQARRLVVQNPADVGGAESTLDEKRWNGSAWSSSTVQNWPVSGWHPVSVVPMPGVAATSGPVAPQGQALLALCVNDAGTTWELQLVHAGAAVRTSVSATMKGAELTTTPWGAWLVGFGGAGKVRYSAGALYLDWCKVHSDGDRLFPSTLCAIDSASVYVLGAWFTTNEKGETVPQVGLVQLDATTNPPVVLWSQQVQSYVPGLAMAMRDPSDSTRILGLLGGRLFQIQAKLPLAIERLKAQGMTAAELLEFVAILHNCVLAPRPDGVLEVISRNSTGSTTALTVDQVKVTQQRVSPNFFTVCRVSTAKDDYFADAWGTTRGGRVLEISSHPLIWTEGVCYGVASTYVAFCGNPRRMEEQTWVHENPDSTPAWETLPRWATVTVNGGGTSWLVTGLSHSLVRGECRATLLEVV